VVNPRFKRDDEVVVAEGDFKGQYGRVLEWEPIFERYFVVLPDVHETGHFAYQEHELLPLDDTEDEVVSDEEEEVEYDEVEVPTFPMSESDFVRHLEFFLERTMSKVGVTGPREAFFGFQEFEGMTPQEILLQILDKLEEGAALFAQAHVLVARMGVALDRTIQEAE
jgi:ribosomal protein L24